MKRLTLAPENTHRNCITLHSVCIQFKVTFSVTREQGKLILKWADKKYKKDAALHEWYTSLKDMLGWKRCAVYDFPLEFSQSNVKHFLDFLKGTRDVDLTLLEEILRLQIPFAL